MFWANKNIKKVFCFSNDKNDECIAYLLFKFRYKPAAKAKHPSGRRALGPRCLVTLCVCFCVPPSLMCTENPGRDLCQGKTFNDNDHNDVGADYGVQLS